jgi:dTDP-4-dehydrorhamnose reductase
MDFADRTQLSLDKLAVLESQLETIRDFILNCGAYTAVDKAESENELADIVNHKAVKLIAQYAINNQNSIFLPIMFLMERHRLH